LRFKKKLICLKCQNIKKLQKEGKFWNWGLIMLEV
jgi:hypothetical protein